MCTTSIRGQVSIITLDQPLIDTCNDLIDLHSILGQHYNNTQSTSQSTHNQPLVDRWSSVKQLMNMAQHTMTGLQKLVNS